MTPPAKPTPSDPLIGQTLADRYLIESVIARGSMGRVYRARQTSLGRVVAIKVVAPNGDHIEGGGDPDQRFMREASILARLTHPNTVRVFDFGHWRGSMYLVMEYVEGSTLKQVMEGRALDPRDALHILRQVVGSLYEAHSMGVVHRDLKPSNILIVPSGAHPLFVKVIDFGLVKEIDDGVEMTGVGMILGTPMYMAPEQIRAKDVDQRTDIYAAGMLLYRALTGTTPWPGGNKSSVLMAHMTQEPPPFSVVAPDLQLPDCIEWTVRRCLEKNPDDRFRDGKELDRALRSCVAALDRGRTMGLAMKDGRLVRLDEDAEQTQSSISALPSSVVISGPPMGLAVAGAVAGITAALAALILAIFLLSVRDPTATLPPPPPAPAVGAAPVDPPDAPPTTPAAAAPPAPTMADPVPKASEPPRAAAKVPKPRPPTPKLTPPSDVGPKGQKPLAPAEPSVAGASGFEAASDLKDPWSDQR